MRLPTFKGDIYTYIRISTKKQSMDDKMGLERQRFLCDEYIKKNYPYTRNISHYEDIGTSYKTGRRQLNMKELLRKIKNNSMIIIAEISRLGRHIQMVNQILQIINEKKCVIVSINDKLTYGISKLHNKKFREKIKFAKEESDYKSRQIKNSIMYRMLRGGSFGRPAFGYEYIKNSNRVAVIKKKLSEFKIIDKIINLSKTNSFEEITNILNTNNELNRGKFWTCFRIKNIVKKFTKTQNDTQNNIGNGNRKLTFPERLRNTKYGNLKILVSNDIEEQHETSKTSKTSKTSSIVKLRSGKEFYKF